MNAVLILDAGYASIFSNFLEKYDSPKFPCEMTTPDYFHVCRPIFTGLIWQF